MIVEQNIDLYSQNTMRLHSIADVVYYPESTEELIDLIKEFGSRCLFLAAGSNVLLPPQIHSPVISLMSLDEQMEILDGGKVCVGCSVRVQKLIRFLQSNGLGGIEYLYSVPASIGGLVYMNGGRGREHNMSISDFLISVNYLDLDDLTIKTYVSVRSDFSYRHSPFQGMNAIILSTVFRFNSQDVETTESLIKDRLDYSKTFLSSDKPSCGTVFCKGNRFIFRLLRGIRVGDAMFSNKTSNWISNVGNAKYEEVCKLIRLAQRIHKLFLCDCLTEIRIIKE